MKSKLTIALAGLAVASLPVLVDAQGTSTPQTRPEQPTTSSQQSRTGRADQNSPQHHLDEAKRVLTSVNANTVQGESRSQVTELKRHFQQLETAWRASSAGSARTGASRSTGGTGTTAGSTSGSTTGSASGTTSGTTTGSASGTTGRTTGSEQTGTTGSQGRYSRGGSAAGNDWMTHYTAINTLLEQMIGTRTGAGTSMSGTAGTTTGTSSGSAGSTTGTSSGTTGSGSERAGSSGTPSASASASAGIEGDVRTKLTEFKRHLDQFHTTAMAQRAPGGEDASAASRSITPPATTSHETPEATTATTGTTGTMSGTAGTAGTSATMTGTAGTTGMTGSASAQNPQTPQPTASTQTTQPTSASATVDSAAIARLTAAIDEMLRGSATTSGTAGTTTTPTGTSATGTTTGTTTTGTTAAGTTGSGTVGTSGTTSSTGTVCVDRAKLEALKTQLQALQNRPR